MRLEEIDASIQIREANLAQFPKASDEKKAEIIAKYNELRTIHSQKKKVISEAAAEDHQLIAEVDAIRLDALNAIQAALNL